MQLCAQQHGKYKSIRHGKMICDLLSITQLWYPLLSLSLRVWYSLQYYIQSYLTQVTNYNYNQSLIIRLPSALNLNNFILLPNSKLGNQIWEGTILHEKVRVTSAILFSSNFLFPFLFRIKQAREFWGKIKQNKRKENLKLLENCKVYSKTKINFAF